MAAIAGVFCPKMFDTASDTGSRPVGLDRGIHHRRQGCLETLTAARAKGGSQGSVNASDVCILSPLDSGDP
ncbi:hypothetical protein MBOU_08650 [Mycobacterium bourgelatii]|uniref:Uncharacterized protein n=1 Tax=Mycobacterium bourgelatii TaxID=1273442 RepID=A0A7I9YJZ4_MYCBU|nr:hypothetical protein MBOU_08650 [Mycobacterium bourgelatii]